MKTYNKALLQTHSVYRSDPYPYPPHERRKRLRFFSSLKKSFLLEEIKFNLTQFTVSSTFISLLHFGRSNFN